MEDLLRPGQQVEEPVDRLASVLSEFARTLLTEFSIQEILDHLVVRIVEALPISAAGVSLIEPGRAPRYVAASNDAALGYERLQSSLREGPCMEAFATGVMVVSPDLEVEDRFSEFTRQALGIGLRAVFSAPMRHSSGRLGALDLYRESAGPLSDEDLVSAQTLADVATAYVLNAEAREEAHASAELFRENSLHDPLTGLPNRTLMMQRMTHAGERAKRSHAVAAVLFADLDGFKQVNDAHGHDVGDQLLVAVAARLQALVRPGDTLARLSGDEFLFLCEDLSVDDDVEGLATRIQEAFDPPFSLSGAEISITASVGVAYSGPGEEITPDLVRDADSAMYAAKRYRKSVGPDLDGARPDRHGVRSVQSLAADLHRALFDEALELAYQPIVRPIDGHILGVEALLRWDHPVRGPVPPPQIVAIAEHAGLIDELGDWVIRRSCTDRADWPRAASTAPPALGVNLSAVQLLNPGLGRTVQLALSDLSVDPATVVFEVTESFLIQDGPRALVVLESLKKLGCLIALDDFGTGYSSLTHLHRFPVDIVKIDRSFVERITLDDAAAAIVKAVTSLAHELDKRVVAEGAQTRRQVARLNEIGCDLVQGYYFARPTSTEGMGSLLREQSAVTQLPLR